VRKAAPTLEQPQRFAFAASSPKPASACSAEALEQFTIQLDRKTALGHCFSAFSSRESVSISLENALEQDAKSGNRFFALILL
jgi:hypothetical protein